MTHNIPDLRICHIQRNKYVQEVVLNLGWKRRIVGNGIIKMVGENIESMSIYF